ncbi:MAG: ribbon-helix-helix domain-containing protein [Pseudomonadota bacterium]
MERVQIMLADGQNEKIAYLAKKLGTTKSRLIREAIEIFLKERVSQSEDPLCELIGQAGEVGATDISSRHDDFLFQKEKGRWNREKSL